MPFMDNFFQTLLITLLSIAGGSSIGIFLANEWETFWLVVYDKARDPRLVTLADRMADFSVWVGVGSGVTSCLFIQHLLSNA